MKYKILLLLVVLVFSSQPAYESDLDLKFEEKNIYLQDAYFFDKTYSKEELSYFIAKFSKLFKLEYNLVYNLINAESGFNHKALSSEGATGLMQLLPSTARHLGWEPSSMSLFNPAVNIYLGCKYLKKMMNMFKGDRLKAVMAYNIGPASVLKGSSSDSSYVVKILGKKANKGGK